MLAEDCRPHWHLGFQTGCHYEDHGSGCGMQQHQQHQTEASMDAVGARALVASAALVLFWVALPVVAPPTHRDQHPNRQDLRPEPQVRLHRSRRSVSSWPLLPAAPIFRLRAPAPQTPRQRRQDPHSLHLEKILWPVRQELKEFHALLVLAHQARHGEHLEKALIARTPLPELSPHCHARPTHCYLCREAAFWLQKMVTACKRWARR
mmetsp:Transcript_32492/g.57413  ORF Transcript_32492/g.57413 Transcript_32492/m.57413 type:complete len:207 (-) Transcript_32492:79-699(-)